jgi:PAS domain S-box-containing protein
VPPATVKSGAGARWRCSAGRGTLCVTLMNQTPPAPPPDEPGASPPADEAPSPSFPPLSPSFPPLLALESIGDAFYVVDDAWRIVFFNACAERHFGRPREEVLGRTVWEVFPSAATSAFTGPFAAAMRDRAVARVEAASVRGDGKWVEVEANPCGSGLSLQVRDISERKRIEHRLRERDTRLEDADRRKDEFLALLAHELRNPLAPLTNVLRLLERSTVLGAPELALLAIAERQRAQMTRLVDDLLDVSRISRGKVALHCEPISVQGAIYDALDSIAGRVEEGGQRVEVDLPGSPIRIVADPARIAQILENLLNNASKYTHQGGRIRVSVTEAPAEVAIAIADDGIGIEPENLALLFEPFRQLDSSVERSAGGLGIGLTLVRRLAELHGGSAVAASEGLGRGASFTVRLPRVAAAAH